MHRRRSAHFPARSNLIAGAGIGAALLLAAPMVFAQDADASDESADDAATGAAEAAPEFYGTDEDWQGYPSSPGRPGDNYYDSTQEHRLYSPAYTGAYYAVSLMGGGAWLNHRDVAGSADFSPSFGVSAEYSSLNQIVNGALSYNFTDHSFETSTAAFDLGTHSIGMTVMLHPLFLSLLSGDRIALAVAGFYGGIGASVDVTRLDDGTDAEGATNFGWHVASGTDFPLSDTDKSTSWWLGFQYRLNSINVPNDDRLAELDRDWFRQHTLMLRLSFRRHGGMFSGFSGPNHP